MKEVKVKKTDLLRHLMDQRDLHVEEHKQAMQNWRQKVVEKVSAEAERLSNDNEEVDLYFLTPLSKPTSYEEDYESAINICEWHEEEVMDLTFEQFSQWVEGNWRWRQDFLRSNAAYGVQTKSL